jgi:hypothetical protein
MFNEDLAKLVARHRARTHAFRADFLRDKEGDVPEMPMFLNTSDDSGIPAYDNLSLPSQTQGENYQP